MPTPADELIDALRAQHDALATLAASFGADDLARTSGSRDWTIAHVLSHRGSAAEIGLAFLQAHLTGDAAPGDEFNQEVWGRWNAKTPAATATDFVGAENALVAGYESLDPAIRADLRFSFGFTPEPLDLAAVVGMRLNEFTLHGWDILVAFDPAATLPTPGPSLLIDRTGLTFHYISHPDGLNGKRGLLAVRTREPDRAFGVELGESMRLVEEPAEPGPLLELPGEAWLRLISGRLAPEHTPASVTLTGDLVDLEDLRRAFPGY